MEITKRQALAAIAPPMTVDRARASAQSEIAPRPFNGARESRREWQVPEWYRSRLTVQTPEQKPSDHAVALKILV